MNKELFIIVMLSIAVSLSVVGGMYYLSVQDMKSKANGGVYEHPKESKLAQPQNGKSGQTKWTAPQVSKSASAIPKKCTQADGSVFYTNAPRCEDADLNNRVSHSDPVKPVPRVALKTKPQSSSKRQSSNKADQGLISVHQNPASFNQDCKYPIGMAQKIEKTSLKLKDNPKDSIWKDSYCRWVCEAEREQCGDMKKYLLYSGMCTKHKYQSLNDCNDIY